MPGKHINSELVRLLNHDDCNEAKMAAAIRLMRGGGYDLGNVRPSLTDYGTVRLRQVMERMRDETRERSSF